MTSVGSRTTSGRVTCSCSAPAPFLMSIWAPAPISVHKKTSQKDRLAAARSSRTRLGLETVFTSGFTIVAFRPRRCLRSQHTGRQGKTETTTSGCLNPYPIAGCDGDARFTCHGCLAAVPDVESPAPCAASSALQAIRSMLLAIREQGGVGCSQELVFANNPVASPCPALSAGSFANAVAGNADWIEPLKGFNRCVPAIGHVGVGGAQ